MATQPLTNDPGYANPSRWRIPYAALREFFFDALDEATHGSRTYHIWMASLTFLMCCGAYAYTTQLVQGLSVTGMHDHVSWGLYISNFTFLVGVAAAAVVLVLPTYVLHDVAFKKAVLIGEAMAVAAVVMAIGFVVVDVGGPARLWHVTPMIGVFNWPQSMLAWDIVVLNVYLVINISVPFYILFSHYRDREPNPRFYVPAMLMSILWAVSLHLVTAFLFAGLAARPHWNNALMGPRFLATAFTAGPALMILVLQVISRQTDYKIRPETIQKMALVVTVAAQITVVMTISEMFKEFYFPTHHSMSSQYLFFGLHGHHALRAWIWTAIAIIVVATAILSVHKLRRNSWTLNAACVLLFLGILIEKGLGTVVPGFIPENWGKIHEYVPTGTELMVTTGIWAGGAFLFTILAKVGVAVELGELRVSPEND
ncbi:MAG: polysulfide reductase NrfD [Bryobacterales bacterium]|nr:polysulfide reductase NrfD [Bryobacterales bacterium]